jgi:hypothetical protein
MLAAMHVKFFTVHGSAWQCKAVQGSARQCMPAACDTESAQLGTHATLMIKAGSYVAQPDACDRRRHVSLHDGRAHWTTHTQTDRQACWLCCAAPSLTTNEHHLRIQLTSLPSPTHIDLLIARIGCPVNIEKHIVCEPCPKDMPIDGVFDTGRNEIVLCENNLISERLTADVITHELVHAFDKCRAKVNFDDPKHLACTEIRAANLSGDCFMWKEMFNRLNFHVKAGQQVRALQQTPAAFRGLQCTPAASCVL